MPLEDRTFSNDKMLCDDLKDPPCSWPVGWKIWVINCSIQSSWLVSKLVSVWVSEWVRQRESEWVRECFEPSQPQRITSGLKKNFTLTPSYSFHKLSYHKSCFLSLLIFRGHSTWESASSRVTYFILQVSTGTSVSQSQHRKKSGEVLEKIQVNGLEG